jgi:methyl-accepting chemotaxis protein
MGRRARELAQEPADDLAELLEEQEPIKPAPKPNSSGASAPSGLREMASLVHLIQANMREQSDRIGHLQQTHEQHNTILTQIIAKYEAIADMLEDHTATLEETLERMETLAAAYIRLIERQTNRRAEVVTPQADRTTTQSTAEQ